MRNQNMSPEPDYRSRNSEGRYHEDQGYNEYQLWLKKRDTAYSREDYRSSNDYRNRYPEDREAYYRSNNDFDRIRGDNDYNDTRGVYGNSTGANRASGPYDHRNQQHTRSRNYGGSDYAHYPDKYRNENYRRQDRDWWDRTKDEVSSWFGDDEAERRRHADELRQSHQGKGPKGYSRPDKRILEDVNDRLTDDSHIDASNIEVEVKQGNVILKGSVANKWSKRHAEDIADDVSGVRNVENRLKIDESMHDEYTLGTGASTTGSYGVPYGSSGAAPVGAFDIRNQ